MGELSKVGPGLHVLPRSKLLRFRFLGTPQRHRLLWTDCLFKSYTVYKIVARVANILVIFLQINNKKKEIKEHGCCCSVAAGV